MARINLGRQLLSSLDQAAMREWLVTDGLGGYAMGSAAGLRTRRYHGLLMVATEAPIGRRLGLAALDPVLVIGERRLELATHEWADSTIAPRGHEHLDGFAVVDGVPRWRWSVGGVVLECEVAACRDRPGVATNWTLVTAGPYATVGVELTALCTWRDAHGERRAEGTPVQLPTADGFVFEQAYRVRGPGFVPNGSWYRGVHYRAEADRGLNASEDLWAAGHFSADLRPGEALAVDAWAGALDDEPPPAATVIATARARARAVVPAGRVGDRTAELLAHGADQFVVRGRGGRTVVAGYPWFGDWSRDTMTSYDGLFLATGRFDDGRELLRAAAASVSEGMLANTADAGGTEYNTVDGSLWFLYTVGRHVCRAGDDDLGAELLPVLSDIVGHHLSGTRFGIRVDGDGLVTQGADGWALTWMDARVDGRAITPRLGKPVEVNALWVAGLAAIDHIASRLGTAAGSSRLHQTAATAFTRRFVRPDGHGLFDVVDGPGGDDTTVRPNQLLAGSLVGGPLHGDRDAARMLLAATSPLVTALGLRSLDPGAAGYLGQHRGGPAERDTAYHQGTVWPWLAGPWLDVARTAGVDVAPLLTSLESHLDDWGLGSMSETADGDAPHAGTGCPFQAWSVAELLRCLP
jgi:predicted glycogen debranching enzyme